MDDEPAVRRIISHTLERAGYIVLEAENGLAAHELILSADGDLELVVTDIEMPQMTGAELVSKLRNEYPNLKILCISAYADPMSPGGFHFLPKPFTPAALVAMVEKVIVSRQRQAIVSEADFRVRLAAAEAKLQAAHEEYNRLMALQQDLSATSDGVMALQQAMAVKRDSLTEYSELLRAFTEFVFRERSPVEEG